MRALVFLICATALAENATFDSNGGLTAMIYGGDELAVRTGLGMRLRNPARFVTPAQSRRTEVSRENGVSTWTSPLEGARFEQKVTETDGKTRFTLRLTAEADLETEGVFFRIDLPRAEFLGGRVEMPDRPPATLPAHKPSGSEIFRGETASLRARDAAGNLGFTATLDRARPVVLVDRWDRGGRYYSAVIEMHSGPLSKGATATLDIALALAGKPDTSPAHLTLAAGKPRYRFQGFGGNYCFNIESPVTGYTLDNLRVAWARTEMTLRDWEPENDNASPGETNWALLESHDQPGSRLRREFLLAKQLQDKKIPYAASIWRLPEWLYTDPGKPPQTQNRRIAPDKWDELLECIGSYLLYAKRQYGVEPDLFSFNEANIGVYVLFNAEEHREVLKRIGAHFRKLGLKTKMLLADATGPRGTHEYALPAANDPEAMQYVGAVGFHSWGGGTPEQYQAWGDLAEWLRLPLLVTELGVDAAAWRGRVYDSFHYGIREARMYQELVLHARPQGTMQWEFTADYGTVSEQDGKLRPTPRFWLIKHFTDLTPPNSEVLTTASDHPKVLLTAFAGGGALALHVLNTGAEREVAIQGIPAGVATLRARRTSESEQYRELAPLPVESGTLRMRMPARSLVTLTAARSE